MEINDATDDYLIVPTQKELQQGEMGGSHGDIKIYVEMPHDPR
jgi:hypothetical protein